jgi:hypothetical protein
MNAETFFSRVKEMRRLQMLYYKSRDVQVLVKAKALEKAVDDEIARVDKVLGERKRQGSLAL